MSDGTVFPATSKPTISADSSVPSKTTKGLIIPSADYDMHQLDSLQSAQETTTLIPKTLNSNSKHNTNNDTKIHEIDKQSLEYVLRSGLAGGLAGVSAKTLIAPLDRVKILFQTNNPHYKQFVGSFKGLFRAIHTIYGKDGFHGLYQGHSATLLRIFPYAAIKFVCYEQIRTILIPRDEFETAGRRLLAGALAGVISVYFTYPLDLIRVRLAFETSHKSIHYGRGKLLNTLRTIYHEQPRFSFNTGGELQNEPILTRVIYHTGKKFQVFQALSNFYRGFIPTIIGMVPYAGVSFYSHDMLHDFFRAKLLSPYTVLDDGRKISGITKSDSSFDHRKPLKTWAQLIAGGGAGMLAQAAAYPFEVIRRRMQVGGVTNSGGQFLTLSQTAAIIYKERGFKGFYVGLGIGFLKIVPMFACSFYVYERCKNYLMI